LNTRLNFCLIQRAFVGYAAYRPQGVVLNFLIERFIDSCMWLKCRRKMKSNPFLVFQNLQSTFSVLCSKLETNLSLFEMVNLQLPLDAPSPRLCVVKKTQGHQVGHTVTICIYRQICFLVTGIRIQLTWWAIILQLVSLFLTSFNFGFLELNYLFPAERGKGQFVGAVDDGSPAEIAGLKSGDRIFAVNGESIVGATHKEVDRPELDNFILPNILGGLQNQVESDAMRTAGNQRRRCSLVSGSWN
jgi:hypothetical protein